MSKQDCLWYELLTKGKREFGFDYGVSIPFLVGAYDLVCPGPTDWKSKDGLRQIFDTMLNKRGKDVELGVMQCGSFRNGDVYILMMLSEIKADIAQSLREYNKQIADKFYTTLEAGSIDELIDVCWDKYKDCILSNNFSAHRTDPLWRPFDDDEKNIIMDL